MKFFIAILLIFTVFNDFTSASFFESDLNSCESQVSCTSVDIHSSNDNHNDSGTEDHHCHLGHAHTLIITDLET